MLQAAHFLGKFLTVHEAPDAPLFARRIHHHQHAFLAGNILRPWQREMGFELVENVLRVGHKLHLIVTVAPPHAAATKKNPDAERHRR